MDACQQNLQDSLILAWIQIKSPLRQRMASHYCLDSFELQNPWLIVDIPHSLEEDHSSRINFQTSVQGSNVLLQIRPHPLYTSLLFLQKFKSFYSRTQQLESEIKSWPWHSVSVPFWIAGLKRVFICRW